MDIEDYAEEIKEGTQIIIVLTGNIGTGKTTVAEFLCDNHEGKNIVVLSNDSITLMTGNGDYQRYNPKLGDMYTDMFMRCLSAAIDADCSVVCDNSYMTRKSRARIVKVAKEAGIAVTSIDMGPGSPETLKRRQDAQDDRCTSNTTWCLVHQRFAKMYEPVTEDEGFDCLVTGSELQEIMNGY